MHQYNQDENLIKRERNGKTSNKNNNILYDSDVITIRKIITIIITIVIIIIIAIMI